MNIDLYYDMGHVILEAVLDAYAATVPAIEPPERQYVHFGNIAADCLAEGTPILTTQGPQRIEDVAVGSFVWSWEDNQPTQQRVTANIAKGRKHVKEVKTRHRTICATDNHKVLRLTPTGTRWNVPNWYRNPNLKWEPEWVPVEDLSVGDFLVTLKGLPNNHSDNYLSDGTLLTEEVAWFLGLMVGDGNITRYGFQCCVYGEIRERALELVERVWGYEGKPNVTNGMIVYSPPLRDLFTELGLFKKSPDRQIPQVIWNSSSKIQTAYLDGYKDADGHTSRSGYLQFAATSQVLIEESRTLYGMLGYTTSNLGIENRTKPIVIKGKQVKNALPLQRFTTYTNYNRMNSFTGDLLGEYFRVDRIASIKDAGEVETYDLTVEGTHNFLADGIVVHNCDQLVVEYGGATPLEADNFLPCIPVTDHIYRIWVIRCNQAWEDDNIPSASTLDSAAQTVLRDAYVLAGLFPAELKEANLCSKLQIVSLEPFGPEGNLGGVILNITFKSI